MANERNDAEWWFRYNTYLQSPEWEKKRKLVLDRARGICEGCGRKKAVQVHHLHYRRVGQEMLFDLVAVCQECHDALHGPTRERITP